MEANRLYPTNTSRSNNETAKFVIDCQARVNSSPTQDTRDWLELSSQIIRGQSNYKIYKAILEKKKKVVAKIGSEVLKREYNIGAHLKTLNLPTLLYPDCIFTCNDTLSEMNQHTRYVCKGSGREINVLLMPYLSEGHITEHKWTRANFHVYKNILKHITATLMFAAGTLGFVHSDLHTGNVMLKRTARKEISYGIYGTLKCETLIPVIMDFDKSKIDMKLIGKTYDDLKNIISLLEPLVDLVYEYAGVRMLIERLRSNSDMSKSAFDSICKEIDAIELIRLKSEAPPQIDFTKLAPPF